uniref:Uncharacterized protein n=1 Tax=Vespula pensylvanica TaxID=30213 RepID=A0A834P5A0_VESPE|nr:hypothetical protein H0235_005781 [Vespula pensylvanica]
MKTAGIFTKGRLGDEKQRPRGHFRAKKPHQHKIAPWFTIKIHQVVPRFYTIPYRFLEAYIKKLFYAVMKNFNWLVFIIASFK